MVTIGGKATTGGKVTIGGKVTESGKLTTHATIQLSGALRHDDRRQDTLTRTCTVTSELESSS